MKETIQNLLLKIKSAEENPRPECTLPQNAYYLTENEILCKDRDFGVSRFPYTADGLIVWAYSNGIIEACESLFHIFKPLYYSEEPTVNFFGGIRQKNGEYCPVALFENSRQLEEKITVKRYTVYSNQCAYYIADTENLTFCVRVHTDRKKHIHFSFSVFNKGGKIEDIYLFSFFEPLLRYAEQDNFWDRMNKYAKRYENSCLLTSYGDYMVVGEKVISPQTPLHSRTVGKTDIFGNRKSILNSPTLKTGEFLRESHAVNTTNLPVVADLYRVTLQERQEIRCEFDLSYYHSREEALSHLQDEIDTDKIDACLKEETENEKKEFDTMKIRFADWKGTVNVGLLNRFLHTVQKQVSVCAFGKNYAGSMIGMRDVMQQLEGSLMWQPEKSREKILNALNCVLSDGRAPRMFSVPDDPKALPKLDLKEYIDQGVWIVSTVYQYLAFTGDFSILEEKCSYYIVDENNTHAIAKGKTDTVLEHLLTVMAFLCNNLDAKTGCLRALYGDWNDAIDALGKTDKKGQKFGSGVSVMASLQFYRNCREMMEILTKCGKYPEKLAEYQNASERVKNGLLTYAVDVNEKGKKRIIHGWGDDYSYKIGSFCDPDGLSRISSIANAFWLLCDMTGNDPTLKDAVVADLNALVSKYGILTFDKGFTPDMRQYVGRISGITKGTYENEAAYVHASLFASCALFKAGQSKRAFEEFEKSIIISHENCTMTPFVMPNSYCYNPEYCIDGESMGDWYTGSGTVVLKEIVRYGFGVQPTLDGLKVITPAFMNCENAELDIMIKGKKIRLLYQNRQGENREYLIDGIRQTCRYDSVAQTDFLYIPEEKLYDGLTVTVLN